MPTTKIKYKGKAGTQGVIVPLRENLQRIVAEALDVPEVESKRTLPEKVALEFSSAHPADVGKDLRIDVFADRYTERYIDIDDRAERITLAVKKLIGKDISMVVCIWLADVGVSHG